MRLRLCILLSSSLILLSACEKEVEFNAPDTEIDSDMTLNAIAVEGEPLTVYLNKAYSVGKAPLLNIGYQFAFSQNEALSDYHSDEYYRKTFILDADVQAVVNGQQTYNLTLANDSTRYVCDYRPKVGDRIEVRTGKLHVETIVPPNPKIKILNYKVIAGNPYKYMDGMRYETDTIMRITCSIPATGKGQYYRLQVRGERKQVLWTEVWYNGELGRHWDYGLYSMQDIFFSEDELFTDNRLSECFGGWPAYFSNVFNNTIIGGNDYSFTIDSPKPPAGSFPYDFQNHITETMEQQVNEPDVPARVMVELQALSPELYRYLKSVELFRITKNDAFSEPVQIYSNVQNGWGIFGALSYDRHFVEYGE